MVPIIEAISLDSVDTLGTKVNVEITADGNKHFVTIDRPFGKDDPKQLKDGDKVKYEVTYEPQGAGAVG